MKTLPISTAARLSGSPAFRDLGGTPAAEGRCVTYGRLYRADALHSAAMDDANVLQALGLRLVCDLRSHGERESTPCLDWLVPAPRSLHLDLSADVGAQVAPWMERLIRGPDPDAAAD